ncbi:hypothetical protein GCM10009823_01490 [Brevibacterium salitolerans]|uniref:PIN domain-containing protein n=1 Tax=Brevibacterium salitolerans TaxID=1403566 RepID=A0ABP5HUN6_9MICO
MRCGLQIFVCFLSIAEQAASLFGEGLPFDGGAARSLGLILQAVVRHGGRPRAHMRDRMIAAAAAANDVLLLTLNAADFQGLESVVEVVEPV